MRGLARLAALSMLVALVPATAASAAESPPQLSAVIVQLDRGGPAPEQVAADTVERFGGRSGIVYRYAISGFFAELSAAGIEALGNNPNVISVTPDRTVSVAVQEIPTGFDRTEADLVSRETVPLDTSGCPAGESCTDVDIAILDTGVNAHPDLHVVARTDCSTISFFSPSCSDGSGQDGNGHGTHVAGSAAAFDNDIGVVGIAPGARIHSVKVLGDNGTGTLAGIIGGVDWITARADVIDVANMSLGGYFTDASFDAAIAAAVDAGIVFAAAAGNDAADADGFSPARHPDVVAVSAVADADGAAGGLSGFRCRKGEVDDTFASFSNFGAVVDIAAPGVCILSTANDGGYRTLSGTSMASPHVAGAAALLVAMNGRDATGDGVIDGADAEMVKAALVADGHAQGSVCGFTGDTDGHPEPMLFVNGPAFGGDGGCEVEEVDSTPPTSPDPLTATADGYPVDLSWAAADDPESGLLEYRIYRDDAQVATVAHTETAYRDRDTAPGTFYDYRVEAVNLQFGATSTGVVSATTSNDDPTDAGWWEFEEGTGTTAADSTAWRRDASLVNGPTWTSREAGGAVNMDGLDDRLDLDAGILHTAGDVTVGMWVRTTKTGEQALVSGANAGNDNEFLLFLPNDTTFRFYVGYSASAGVEFPMTSIADGEWHHLALVRDQTLNRVAAYRDGVLIGETGLSVTMENLEIEAFVIGQEQDTVGGGYQASQALSGGLDDLRLYSRVLSGAEIADLAQRDATPPTGPDSLIGQATSAAIDLEWSPATDDESGIAGYEIWRDDGAGSAKTLQHSVPGSQTTWRDTAVRPETSYRYEVVARNGAELVGPASPEAVITSGAGDTGLLGWWALDDGAGLTATDWSAHSRDGTLVGGPVWSSDGVGGSLVFDGADDHVTIDSGALDGHDDVSLSLRFRTTKAGIQAIVSGANSTNDAEFLVVPVTSTAIRVYTGETAETHQEFAVPNISDGEWHHLAVTRQGSTDTVGLYLDGVSYGAFTHTMNPLEIAAGGLLFGQEQDSVGGSFDPTQAFEGSLDEVRFYDRILTAGEVADLAGLGAPILDFEAPVAPTGLSAVAAESEILLDWDDNLETDLASYAVYRSETAGGGYTLVAEGLATSEYADTAVIAGTAYFYVVTAFDHTGNESEPSVEVTATVEVAAPNAPTGLTATAGIEEVALDWADQAGVTFNVYRATTAGGPYGQVASGLVDSTYLDTTVTAGTEYFYVVRAFDGSQESADSNEVSAIPEAQPVAPDAPTGLVASDGVGEITLTWDVVAGLSYTVSRAEVSGGPYTEVATGLTSAPYVDSELASGEYFYVVAAVDDGTGQVSEPSAEVSGHALPAAPTGLAATAGVEEVALDWTDHPEGSAVTYRVYRWTASEPVAQIADGLTVSEYLDTGLTAGVEYSYAVAAVDGDGGESAQSASASATPTAAPEEFEVYASTEATFAGSVVSGDLGSTLTDDGVAEVLAEQHNGGRPVLRVSSLDHRWTFQVGNGEATTLIIDAHRTANSDGDDFRFEYSMDGAVFSPVHVVDNGLAGDPVSIALPAGVTGTVTIRVVDTNRETGNASLDEVHVDLLALVVSGTPSDPPPDEEPSPGEHYAYLESTSFGTVSGSLFDTHAADGSFEAISEEGWAGGSRSRLEHTWTFDVTPSAPLSLSILAIAGGGEDFVVAYSVDGSSWTDAITVTSAGGTQTATITPSVTGTMYVRVTDTNRNKGDSTISTISVDHLVIYSG